MASLDFAGVEELQRRFHDAVAAEDIETIVGMYARDAVILPAGGPAIEGQAAIESFWRAGIKAASNVKLHTRDVRPLGEDVVQEMGDIDVRSPIPSPATKYLVIWRRFGPQWLLQTDMWNASV